MAWLVEPPLGRAHGFLAEQVRDLALNRRTLVVVGRCRIEYQGRAESTLEAGDRVVLVKADGTLLIHNPWGLKPVNWQPPGCDFSVAGGDRSVLLEAARKKPAERVRIEFERIDAVGVVALRDDARLALRGTEFDIRDALRVRPELVEPGFKPWERERLTERGPMDLYGEDARGRRVVVEVKRVRAGIAEATQLWRYVDLERRKHGTTVRGILVAPALTERARLMLRDHGLEYRKVDLDDLRARAIPLGDRGQPSLLAFGPSGRVQTGRD